MYRWQRTDIPQRPGTRPATRRGSGSLAGIGVPVALTRLVVLVLMTALLGGCATQRVARKGEEAVDSHNYDAAVYYYLEALAKDPENLQYRISLVRARQKASQEHFKRGMALGKLGRLTAAQKELEMAVQLDPTHQFAETELTKLNEELQILSKPGGEATLEEMKRRAREAKVKPPILNPASKEPITLNFPKAKPVKEIYQAMAKAYGFNVLFDPKLKDDKLSIELNDVTAERALEIVMQAAGHFYKVLDEHSIIIAEETPQNRREYEDLVIKTFFLSNADVKEVDKLLRSLIEARRLATNEQLNAITLRDTADKVAIAEKLIAINDKAKAEVLVDVELIEMSSSGDSDIGANLSSYNYMLSLDESKITDRADSSDSVLYLPDVNEIMTRDAWFMTIPDVVINLVKSSGMAETLAQPQLRITEGEKASLVLGNRVPIPVTAFNQGTTGGGGVVPITSFQYQDVGIKIDVEPRVHHNQEVTLNLTVEVSQLGDEVSVGPNQSAVTIGTRTITSVIRLRNGETSLLAGLLRIDRSESSSETPGLSQIPLLGRLFTIKGKKERKSELVLTLTPHIVRFPDIKEEDLAPVWVGTESRIAFYGNRPRVTSGRGDSGPFDQGGSPTPQIPIRRVPTPTRPIPEIRRPQPGGGNLIPGGKTGGYQPGESSSDPSGRSGGLREDTGEEGSEDDASSGWRRDSKSVSVSLPGDLPLSGPALIVGLEPSVVSMVTGQQTELNLVTSGSDADSFRISLGISYDPKRIRILELSPAAEVAVLDHELDDAKGWLSLQLMTAEGADDDGADLGPGAGAVARAPRMLGSLLVEALEEGPVPLYVTSDGAVDGAGEAMPVATGDGAIYVQAEVPTTAEVTESQTLVPASEIR